MALIKRGGEVSDLGLLDAERANSIAQAARRIDGADDQFVVDQAGQNQS
jgi:hypothetical protein